MHEHGQPHAQPAAGAHDAEEHAELKFWGWHRDWIGRDRDPDAGAVEGGGASAPPRVSDGT